MVRLQHVKETMATREAALILGLATAAAIIAARRRTVQAQSVEQTRQKKVRTSATLH
jgi:predicted histidine transporter YuiF (NhaC family)